MMNKEAGAPHTLITLNGPDRVAVAGNLTSGRTIQVMQMRSNTRNNLNVGKFSVCTGVYDEADLHLINEIIGQKWQQSKGAYSQSHTVDSMGRAAELARANSLARTGLVGMDVEMLSFVLSELDDWTNIKNSERLDVACEILRGVYGHVWLGRTDARRRVRELLQDVLEVKVKGKENPSATSACIVVAIPEFVNQRNFDRLSEKSLDNMLGVALLLEQQIASFVEYLGYCVKNSATPSRGFLDSVYQNIDIKPYSYALDYVRDKKKYLKQRHNGSKSYDFVANEVILLYETVETEYRLDLASRAISDLRHKPDHHEPTLERIVESCLIDRYHYSIYDSFLRELNKTWKTYKKHQSGKDFTLSLVALVELQKAIRYRAVDSEKAGGHPWAFRPLEIPPLPKQPSDPFKGLPRD